MLREHYAGGIVTRTSGVQRMSADRGNHRGSDDDESAPPRIPRLDRKPSERLKAEEVQTLLASVRDWYALERIRQVANEEVLKARDFLIENRATTDKTGAELPSEEGWFPF